MHNILKFIFDCTFTVPDLSWGPQQPPVPVDDEWSGLSKTLYLLLKFYTCLMYLLKVAVVLCS